MYLSVHLQPSGYAARITDDFVFSFGMKDGGSAPLIEVIELRDRLNFVNPFRNQAIFVLVHFLFFCQSTNSPTQIAFVTA